MRNKIERELYGPGMGEVLLGAMLSLLLGVVLAAVFLVLKPAKVVKELPKDRVEGMVYYVEGSRAAATAESEAKRRTIEQGGTVDLSDGDLNVLLGSKPKTPAAKPAAKGKEPAKNEATSAKMLTTGEPNFRIHDGVLQIGVPLHLSVLGYDDDVIVQANGSLQKSGSGVAFVPTEFYVGSCPVQRLPGVSDLVMKRLAAAVSVPEELAKVWSRVSNATLEGSTLHLTVQ